MFFTIKAFSGRLKAGAVACGCFQSSQARGKEHTFASGTSAEVTRLLLRKAGLSGYAVGSVDIKTALLNAPVVAPNDEKVIVRVPGVMRQAGICTEKYWLVRKALYGLDVAPKSWTIHKNASLKGIPASVWEKSGMQAPCRRFKYLEGELQRYGSVDMLPGPLCRRCFVGRTHRRSACGCRCSSEVVDYQRTPVGRGKQTTLL